MLQPHCNCAGSLELLLNAGADIDTICLTYEGVLTTPLMTACDVKCCDGPLRLLLQRGADPCKGAGGALHPAIRSGQVDKCRLLLAGNTGLLQLRDSSGKLPLFAAVESGDVRIVRLLHEEHGLDLRCTDQHGNTLLHSCMLQDQPQQLISYLLQRGLSVNAVNHSGATALHEAAQLDHLAAAELLVARGADATLQSSVGLTALGTAVVCGSAAVAQRLINSGVAVGSAQLAFFGAVTAGAVGMVELLLRNGMPTTVRSVEDGYPEPLPPLAMAVIHGQTAVVRALLAARRH
jgi:ankyrin repeat protein